MMIGQVPQASIGLSEGTGENQTYKFGRWWMTWFNQVYTLVFSIQQSGNTASRPTTNLWIGRRYFDTTLGKPVWIKSVGPPVWVDATGAVV